MRSTFLPCSPCCLLVGPCAADLVTNAAEFCHRAVYQRCYLWIRANSAIHGNEMLSLRHVRADTPMVQSHQQRETDPNRRKAYTRYLMLQQPHQSKTYCERYAEAFTNIAEAVRQLPSIRRADGRQSLHWVVEEAFAGVPASHTTTALDISDAMEVAHEDVVAVAQYVDPLVRCSGAG